MKIRVGIIFGGPSREREVSFAGGRTVYDNLNKSLFEAVPVFVDSFRNFWLLDWQYIYKGSIRDFYPAEDALPDQQHNFQLYAENLGDMDIPGQEELLSYAGKMIRPDDLSAHFDVAFLALHGSFGEDGKLQGMLEYLDIPYTGSGILPSAIGIDKVIQRGLMEDAGFDVPSWFSITRDEWRTDPGAIYFRAKKEIGFPLVVKAATQGSSIGVTIVNEDDEDQLLKALERGFFCETITKESWQKLDAQQKADKVRQVSDIREGIGLPALLNNSAIIYAPEELLAALDQYFSKESTPVRIEARDTEHRLMIESFIEGKEFSCIVIQDMEGRPVALPPTEIRKGKELFDYRSKYLPGLSRKITPIQIPDDRIRKIRSACELLFSTFSFDVYARIDGFINDQGQIFLNDPNTTSGMMPSSFFFHQAAEIGLNPSQFLTYIIFVSLKSRSGKEGLSGKSAMLLEMLNRSMKDEEGSGSAKKKVAVFLGGYSSERHISVESGRNIYEKLASSPDYEPFPVFVTGSDEEHELYTIPVNVMLKDNADDILEKVRHFEVHPVVQEIIEACDDVIATFGNPGSLAPPSRIDYNSLSGVAEEVFIALHGRPGEDGAVQEQLDRIGIPYNGSDADSSRITINKFQTNEILRDNGYLVADHTIVSATEWTTGADETIRRVEEKFIYPFIAKPVDDGCSSAVKKIKNREELIAFANLIFRPTGAILEPAAAGLLHLKPKEEFPCKQELLIEELITRKDARHFLEITGGLLTHFGDDGEVRYEMFEASEALAEGEVLSLEEKFLAGQGQNITPARYSKDSAERQKISDKVKETLEGAARVLNIQGYARIDAFVRIYNADKVEVIFVEVNSLPGMTPATCIFHQTAINGYKPFEFINKILEFGAEQKKRKGATA